MLCIQSGLDYEKMRKLNGFLTFLAKSGEFNIEPPIIRANHADIKQIS